MTVRLGVVGVGDVAQRDYLPEFARLAGRAEITMVCSHSEARAREVSRRFEVARWTTRYQDVLSAAEVDAVVNLTPVPLHEEVTLAALRAGKHVYSEKPVASGGDGVRRIATEAERAQCLVVAAPSIMLFPQIVQAAGILASGRLGPVHSVRAYAYGGVPPWGGYTSDPAPFFAEGAGPLVDMAVYPLHALTGLLGPVKRVMAISSRTRDTFVVADGPAQGRTVDVKVDDNWHLMLNLDGGQLASVQANFCVGVGAGCECEFQGEWGTLGLSLLDVAEPLTIFGPDGTEHVDVEHARTSGPDHVLGVEHLVQCILDDTRPLVSLGHAGHVIDILDAARASAQLDRAADVAQTIKWRGEAYHPDDVPKSAH